MGDRTGRDCVWQQNGNEEEMKWLRSQAHVGIGLVAATVLAAACSGALRGVSEPSANELTPANGVSATAVIAGKSQAGDSVVITFSNGGTQTAYMSRCGSQPLVLMQQFIGEQWVGGVQNFMCPVSSEPGPVKLAPGGTFQLVRFLDATGRYRFFAAVGSSADLSDAQRAVSNGVDVP
jgi:hypothetical protein